MTNPLSTIEVLRAEAKSIHGDHVLDGVQDEDLTLALNTLESTALCLSGGGIRSATFGLGIIQALAARPRPCKDFRLPPPDKALLGQFNYLSTVSGGGYIGSWLSAWLSRQPYADVLPQLNTRGHEVSAVEPTAIGDLRRDSNYLTPKVGLVSADTWAAAAMILRNLLLNWVLLIPLFLLSLVVVKLAAVGVAWLSHPFGDQKYGLALIILAAISLVLVLIGLRFTLRAMRLSGTASPTQGQFLKGNLLPMFLGGVAWTGALDTTIGYQLLIVTPLADLLVFGGILGFVVYGAAQLITLLTTGELFTALLDLKRWARLKHRTTWGWLVAGIAYGAFLGFGAHIIGSGGDPAVRLLLLLLFAPPWLLVSQLMAETCYVALTSNTPRSDEQREWFARSAGWYLATCIAWIAGVALALLGSWTAGQVELGTQALFDWMVAGGGATAMVGWLTGGSGRTSAQPSNQAPNRSPVAIAYNVAASLSAPLFFALLLVLGSAVIDLVVLRDSLFAYLISYGNYLILPDSAGSVLFQSGMVEAQERSMVVPLLVIAGVILGIIALFASKYININRFSLHGLYRNRLVRAFLGASHIGRKPDRFTGFDMDDNPTMQSLWPAKREDRTGDNWRPFHVLNTTLNVISTRNLAWQQRKGMSFTITPLHSGAASLCPLLDQPGGTLVAYRGAYRPSSKYGGSSHSGRRFRLWPFARQPKCLPCPEDDPTNPGISLGTAMAISGAAVDPNAGYHSSPTVSLLLTLLNMRLGWWLGNPAPVGDKSWYRNGPPTAAVPLVKDAFGLTTDDQPYVSLSDGGHFEDLGLYEMVRRRCRYIVISDAGEDPTFTYSDLGMAVRKIGIDFGIPIRFHELQKMQPRPAPGVTLTDVPYHAMGVIDYAMADGPAAKPGIILYVKASFHNCDEGAGVKAYANSHPTFPHESTTDQWFSESQFESYRALGFQIMDSILAEAQGCATDLANLKQILDRLAEQALKEECEECDPPVLQGA
ncbi:hypothetical protein AZA_21378 [Nitrospirillum viridazoti Y2]|uniref:Patatin-like phospholipase n=1 Tax=Nitrospirillum amazonense TaxID=28077 RepID=A0A560I8K2_9PROT|nr:patatin-like phospholipase family protein [Nitrospirillum amazonense]EGX99722.1 hypothetical protein AZA_21378 [Nitrospirillum amazonense Y2]TWB54381.1 patatin-like phospholipase [Nitrospirillum amazonense]